MGRFSCHLIRATTVGFAASAAALCQAGIDLTPVVTEYTAEGRTFQQLGFHEDKLPIEYEPPLGWSFDGGATELHLKPPQKNFAEAVIAVASLGKPQMLDENVRAALKQKMIADLPGGSQLAKIEQEVESPLLLNGNPTFEITASYQLMGEKFSKSVLFANVRDTQLTFRITARSADFESLHQQFRTSILSWHWTEAPKQAQQVVAATAPATSN